MATRDSVLNDEAPSSAARGVTVWNDAGGVGKTTVTVNTASALGRAGRDVLAIDIDPQAGGLTHHAGFSGALTHAKYKLTDVLLNESRTLDDIVIPGEEYELDYDLIPAHESIGEFSAEVATNVGPQVETMNLLRSAIKEAGFPNEYDVILIDAPATRGLLVENAIAATRNVLIPTEPSPKGGGSVDGLHSYVKERQRKLRREADDNSITLNIIGILLNNCAKTGQFANTERAYATELSEAYPEAFFPFYIPSRQVLADAWDKHDSLFEFVENHRDLRPNERDLPEMFELIGRVIEDGSIEAIGEYEGKYTVKPKEVVHE